MRIVATGAFRDPADPATYAISVQGSGFIIDPSGLAVTNNHVVAGNARLDVYFNAESEPHNATVLGVSECSDLALIDIEGNDHRYLEWYTEEILAGIDVYTIGYPFGVTSFAMTRGIVSQPRANGETSWSSVDYAILHDATISPGNSGGPLVNAAGEVVGVNYARDADNSQNFAVGREEAYRVLDELREGYDVTSIGISGSVVPLESGHYGIWVAAVGSGSPAAAVGLLPGDVITSLENLPASDEGTFEQYCDTLRSRRSGDALRVDVTRSDTNQLLSGEINGAPLSPVGSTSGGGGTAAAGGTAGAAPTGGTGETGGAGGTAGAAPTGGTGETGGAGGTAGAAPTGGTGETGGAGGTAGTAAIGGTGPTGGSAGSGGAGGTAGTAPTGGAADTGAGGGTAGASAAAAGGREDTPITANLRLRNHVTRADSDSLATVEPSVQDLFIELTVITGTCSDCVEAPVELTAQFSSARRAGRGAASVATTSA